MRTEVSGRNSNDEANGSGHISFYVTSIVRITGVEFNAFVAAKCVLYDGTRDLERLFLHAPRSKPEGR